MARKSIGDIQLSFKKNAKSKGGMFYKKYKDPKTGKWKAKYFGAGRCKSDREFHRKAVAKCLAFEEERELQLTVGRIYARSQATLIEGFLKAADAAEKDPKPAHQHMQEFMDALVKQPSLVNKPKELHEMTGDELARQLISPEALAQHVLYIRQAAERKVAPARGQTIDDHIDAWLETEALKVGTDQLSSTGLRDKKSGILQFREHAGAEQFDGHTGQILMSYRNQLLMKLADGEYAGNTFNDKIKFAGQFIKWCWENEILDKMPRCMDAFSKRVPVRKEGKPIPLPDIHKLYSTAGDRMKCFIAIALNTGMKNGDIAALKGKQLRSDRLIGYRPKTKRQSNVPFNVKLWPVTVGLIRKCRDKHSDNELLFVNKADGAVKSGTISSLFKKVSTKAGVIVGETKGGNPKGVTFEQLRDTSIDLLDKKLFEIGYDRGLLQVFQQHADPSTASYYRDKTPERMQIDKLDELTDYLDEVYGLKL